MCRRRVPWDAAKLGLGSGPHNCLVAGICVCWIHGLRIHSMTYIRDYERAPIVTSATPDTLPSRDGGVTVRADPTCAIVVRPDVALPTAGEACHPSAKTRVLTPSWCVSVERAEGGLQAVGQAVPSSHYTALAFLLPF